MHIGQKLKSIILSKKKLKKELAEEVGISPTHLSGILNKPSIDCELLQRFCNALNVSPAVFFDTCQQEHCSSGADNALQVELTLLRQLIDEKERMIQTLLSINAPGQNRDKTS